MGKEGRQAIRCSDFAFARFRFLRRVLLVHGHWYYWRVSSLVQYFFYKNIAFNTPVVFFTIFSAYSTQVLPFGALSCTSRQVLNYLQSLYDGIFLTCFNLIFTALPILVFGMLDQNFTSAELYNQFHLYQSISGNALLSWPQFFKWILLGTVTLPMIFI
jgi:phospholipid-translocating ATPase